LQKGHFINLSLKKKMKRQEELKIFSCASKMLGNRALVGF